MFQLVDISRPNSTRLNSFHLNIAEQGTKLIKPQTDSIIVIEAWNNLPNETKAAPNIFKRLYDRST